MSIRITNGYPSKSVVEVQEKKRQKAERHLFHINLDTSEPVRSLLKKLDFCVDSLCVSVSETRQHLAPFLSLPILTMHRPSLIPSPDTQPILESLITPLYIFIYAGRSPFSSGCEIYLNPASCLPSLLASTTLFVVGDVVD